MYFGYVDRFVLLGRKFHLKFDTLGGKKEVFESIVCWRHDTLLNFELFGEIVINLCI